MKNFLDQQSEFYRRVPDMVRQHKWKVWIGFVLITVLLGIGAGRFQLDLTDEFFFQEEDPVRVAYDQFRAEFGGDESVYIVYKPKDGDVFSAQSLAAVRNLQEELLNYRLGLKPGESSALDHVVDITSLINVSYLKSSDDALISQQFIGDRIPKNQTESDRYRQLALSHADYPRSYVSADGQYGGIIIRTDFKTTFKEPDNASAVPMEMDNLDLVDVDISSDFNNVTSVVDENRKFESVEMEDYAALMKAIHAVIDQAKYADVLDYYPVGAPPINAFVFEHFVAQVNVVMALTVLLTIAMLWILFRSASAIVWPILIFAAASLATVGLMGWLQLKMNLMINVSVLLILVVGIADAVHVMSGYIFFRNRGEDHQQALRSTYAKTGLAVLLTSITTAIGMLALMVVPLLPVQRFGMSAAIGVAFAYVFSIFLLPLMLDIWSPVAKKRDEKKQSKRPQQHLVQSLLLKVEHLSYARPNLNIGIFVLLTIFFGIGISKIQVDSNFINVFAQGTVIRDAVAIVDEHMGGTQGFEIMLEGESPGLLQDPLVLNAMDDMQNYLEKNISGVVSTRSLVDVVKDSNQSLNGGRTSEYRIPQEPLVLQQTLFLFNNANPSDRRRVVSDDYRKGHISVNMRNSGSKDYIAVLDQVDPELKRIFATVMEKYPDAKISVTGGLTIITKLVDYLSWSQIKGFGIALAIISLILLFLFGSKRVGVIALFPNLFPLIVVFGSMGYLGIALDVDTLVVAPLMIGIVVDDTIHFLTHYRDSVVKDGNIEKGIISTFREVGQAITFTSIILAVAFLTFLLLDHQGLKNFGFLSSLAILTALAAELFLLPSLLLKGKINFARYRDSQQTSTIAATKGV